MNSVVSISSCVLVQINIFILIGLCIVLLLLFSLNDMYYSSFYVSACIIMSKYILIYSIDDTVTYLSTSQLISI